MVFFTLYVQSKSFIAERISMLHDRSTYLNIHRSKSCKIILNWCAKTEVCETCQHSFKTNFKRKNQTYVDENDTPAANRTCDFVDNRKVLAEKNIPNVNTLADKQCTEGEYSC